MFSRLFQRAQEQKQPSEYEKVMAALPHLSYEVLDQMHQVLLNYCLESPFPGNERTPEEYLAKIERFENSPIKDGAVYGCKTYGEAIRMNTAIVKQLDILEG